MDSHAFPTQPRQSKSASEVGARNVVLPPRPFPTRQWNTNVLLWRIAADAASAGCAAVLVAPLITILDRGIIERAASKCTLKQSIFNSLSNLILRPHHFLISRPVRLIAGLYFGTYMAANTVDTLTSTVQDKPADSVTCGPAKFAATSSVNMSLCLYKDSQFARMFGAVQQGSPASTIATRSIPLATYALFAVRDSLTILASFNLPPFIAPVIPLTSAIEDKISRMSMAQCVAPALMQFASTPLHLYGLDLYNRPGSHGGVQPLTFGQRLVRVRRDWMGGSFARMLRILPAFGGGGIVNAKMRKRLMNR